VIIPGQDYSHKFIIRAPAWRSPFTANRERGQADVVWWRMWKPNSLSLASERFIDYYRVQSPVTERKQGN
jgi:hypothetical protein